MVLDIGCGDGELSARIAEKCKQVVGLDASGQMVAAARGRCAEVKQGRMEVEVVDCRHLGSWVDGNDFEDEGDVTSEEADGHKRSKRESYDKVFSNASLHWILHDPTTRLGTLRAAHSALVPHGTLVFEMGGAGNVAEVHAVLISSLARRVGIEAAREASPWFFPSEMQMSRLVEKAGFKVEKIESEYRPTRLTDGEDGGLEGWIRLMAAGMLEAVGKGARETVVREVL